MILSNFFQIVSSLYYIFFPHFNKSTPFITATAVLLTWISLGYFLEFDRKYSFFYVVLKRSGRFHLKYLLIFFIFFMGVAFLAQSLFSNSHLFSSTSQSARTLFALVFADSVYNIMSESYNLYPLSSMIFYITFICLTFLFAQRLLISATEEAFDSIKFKSSYYWLEKQISVEDYLNIETENKNDQEHYMLSDVMMNLILDIKEQRINKLEDILMLDESKVKADGYDVKKVREVFRKHFKKIKRETISNEIMQDIIKHDYVNDPHGISLRLGLTETLKVKNFYEYSEKLFHTIDKHIDKIIDASIFNENNPSFKKQTLKFIDKINKSISNIKHKLN